MRLDHLLSKEQQFTLTIAVNQFSLFSFQCTNITLFLCGGVAQLVEHLPCKQGVRSSTLLISTTVEFLIYLEVLQIIFLNYLERL